MRAVQNNGALSCIVNERTGMQPAILGNSGFEAAPQLQGQIAKAFSRQQFDEHHREDGSYSIYFDSSTIIR